MRDIIIARKNGMDGAVVEEQAFEEAGKLRNVVLYIQQISKKRGVEQIDKLLEKIFENELVMDVLKLRVLITALQEIIVDENE